MVAAHPIKGAQDNVFIKVSFDEGGNAPTLGISDERAYHGQIRGIMEASVNPGMRHRNTAATAAFPNTDLVKPHTEPHNPQVLQKKKGVISSVKKVANAPVRSVKSASRRPSYSRSASRAQAPEDGRLM